MTSADEQLKQRHKAMWASGDYPSMVETFLLPLGPVLPDACQVGGDHRVLDVAAGTGNASIHAAQRGATVVASDLTPELLDAGRARAAAAGVELEWAEADAENLPFGDEEFDVVPPPLWGSEEHLRGLFGDRVQLATSERRVLEVTAFQHPVDFAAHFKQRYGPTIATMANARQNGREQELDNELDKLYHEWNLGTADHARFEMQYLVAVGTRA